MAIRRAQPGRGADLSGRDRFLAALAGDGLAFAPIVWDRLPALVRQERADWWQDATLGQRLIADAAALAGADAMFVCVGQEAVRCAATADVRGDDGLESLASTPETQRGIELVRVVRRVAGHGVIATLPAPAGLRRALGGEEAEAAEDAFSDLVSAFLDAGADAVAVTGQAQDDVHAGVARAGRLARLFGRPVLAVCEHDDEVSGWNEDGNPLGVISAAGEWPDLASGVVITSGDVSSRWDAARLRGVGLGRPVGCAQS